MSVQHVRFIFVVFSNCLLPALFGDPLSLNAIINLISVATTLPTLSFQLVCVWVLIQTESSF